MRKSLIIFALFQIMSVGRVVKAETTEDIPIDSLPQQTLSEVVVTGSNRAVEARLLPYTVSVIDKTELESAPSNQLLSILSGRVPSLFVTERGVLGFGVSSNGGAGHIKMRGVGGDRASAVLMMVDGQPQFAGLYSHHVADFYSKENVERVEVLRGPASVLYGSNAMAGTINVITRNPAPKLFAGSFSTQFGSYNTWQTTATISSHVGNFSAMGSASYDRTDGNVKNFDFKQWSGYGKVGYRVSSAWKGTADFTLMNFKANDPLYPKLSNPESTDIYHQSITRGEASLMATDNYGNTNGAARVYYSWGNHFIQDPRAFHSLDDRFGIIAYQNFAPWRDANATIGFDFARYSGEIPMSGGVAHTPGALSTIERKYITEYSPYLTVSQSLWRERIALNAGVRVAMSSMFPTRGIPQAGIVINPSTQTTIKASAAMGYRNPSFRELYLYRMANPELQPERMWNYEISASQRIGSIAVADLTLYYSRGSNMIQAVDMKNVNTGSFINKGIEVSLRLFLLCNLTATATYSFLHTSLSDLTGAPRHQYFMGIDWLATSKITVNAELRGIAHLYIAPTIPYQSYALLNVKASYQILKFLRLFIDLDNITDASYMINRGYPMPGFTANGGFLLSF